MSEQEWRELVWQSCTKRIVAMITDESANWGERPSKAVANAIIAKIKNMPVPGPNTKDAQ